MFDRESTPENIPIKQVVNENTNEFDLSSSEEETQLPVAWYKDEIDFIVFVTKPPLAPFPRGNPPERLCHRVSKKIKKEQLNWRHSIRETKIMLRRELERLYRKNNAYNRKFSQLKDLFVSSSQETRITWESSTTPTYKHFANFDNIHSIG
nr:15450_t:CDS:2 [Entrophospora candida]CAG8527901.1 3284_t:CDS:2 [Entrophospora candida]